ncbi:unnamed protein product [Lupinus luteus]|uniref:SWIRM domain-containing protein n=1 Tax=Lupinus luteus TaxID=3873 RepID=A0AAV1W429_LUPLU
MEGNVKIWLTKAHIRESVSSDCEHLINYAYDFLFYNGYINFGVAPSFNSHIPETVFEGNDRPGGRVYTKKLGSGDNFASIDLGGSIITGIDANPLAVLARQLSIPLHRIRDKCPLYKPNGELVARK